MGQFIAAAFFSLPGFSFVWMSGAVIDSANDNDPIIEQLANGFIAFMGFACALFFFDISYGILIT